MTRPEEMIASTDLDGLMPFHLRLDSDGTIRHVAPSLGKLRPGTEVAGCNFFEVFTVRRPWEVSDVDSLIALNLVALRLQFVAEPRTLFKAVLVGDGTGGAVINLSFGVSIIEAIREYDLKNDDFDATDLSVEMLYLMEANAAIRDELRGQNARLHSARLAAEQQALTDTLTQLGNRRVIDTAFSRLLAGEESFGVIRIDLDLFKRINDTLGHAAGDHALQFAARAMLEVTRPSDTLARIGGDEFVILVNSSNSAADLRAICDRLMTILATTIRYDGAEFRISASIGIALSEQTDTSADELLRRADIALYTSKRRGGACTTVYADSLDTDWPPQVSQGGGRG